MTDYVSNGNSRGGSHFDVVIVGAGFGGLYMLHHLRELGFSARVLERADAVGGTWYWNRYPGARCDVPSLVYSYSFSSELEQDWNWSEKYATQPEILRYLNHVADRFDLRRGIDFVTSVDTATWLDGAARWSIGTSRGETITAQFLVMATGCLSQAKPPEIAGVDGFAGPVYFTARWPHEGVDFAGRRVGMIGTGSSGIQSIPIIAEQAARLTVFQRTPNFSMPARNRLLEAAEIAERRADYRAFRQASRESPFGEAAELPALSALEVSAEERNARYQEGWDAGRLLGLLVAFTDTMTDEAANSTAAEFVRDKIRAIVKDTRTAEALCPFDHPFGTKRPCLDSGYYATYNRDDVRLVNLRTAPITEITATGIRTREEEFTFDALVFATGFDAMTGALLTVDITGRNGLRLRAKWAAGPRTYLGLMMHGFPNLFTITGPGSPSVFSNMVVSIEQHVELVGTCLTHLRDNHQVSIEPTEDGENAWMQHIAEAAAPTLFPLADSWYMGANVPGKPRALMPYVGGVGVYRQECDEIVADDFRGFVMRAASRPAAA